jgi:hypothetical protein
MCLSPGIFFRNYPRRQKAASFSLDKVMEAMSDGAAAGQIRVSV